MVNRSYKRDGERRESSAHRRVLRYGPVLVWMAFIAFASTNGFSSANTSKVIRPLILWFLPNLSEAELSNIHVVIRKLAHFAEYGLLALLAGRAFVTSSVAFIRSHWFLLGMLLVSLYSLADEFHQSFVLSRTGSLYDSAIDMAGGFTVLLIFHAYRTRVETSGRDGERARR